MAANPYKKMPGRSHGILQSSTLWEGDDHLLLVESYRVSESYKRFFYRDIHAIVICRTRTGLVTIITCGILGALCAAGAFAAGSALGVMLGVFASLFFLVALFGAIRGHTCRCTLQTAVQTQRLTSLSHLRTARKALLRLQPKILAAQQSPPPQ